MTRIDLPDAATHDEARLALPWLANGTLAGDEAAAVEAHLASCAACRDELAAERQLAARLAGGGEVAPAPHPVQLARLWARIDGESAPEETLRVARWPAAARWLLAAQAAAILALAGVALRDEPASRAAFRTLAAEAPREAPTTRLRVVFADSVDQRALRELLLPIRAEIVGGPSPLGVYTLALPETGEPLAWVVAHLRARPEVRFAEPVAGTTEP